MAVLFCMALEKFSYLRVPLPAADSRYKFVQPLQLFGCSLYC